MLNGMLFQDFAPAYLTDLKPYCNVFGCVIKIPPSVRVPHVPASYHTDEHLIVQ